MKYLSKDLCKHSKQRTNNKNDYYFFPEQDDIFKKEALEDKIVHVFVYSNNKIEQFKIKVSKYRKSDVSTLIRTTVGKGIDISKKYNNATIIAFPERYFNKFNFDEFLNTKDIKAGNLKNTITNLSPLNQILYGPPGTGKTYNTVIKAMEIIGIKEIFYNWYCKNSNANNKDKTFKEYNVAIESINRKFNINIYNIIDKDSFSTVKSNIVNSDEFQKEFKHTEISQGTSYYESALNQYGKFLCSVKYDDFKKQFDKLKLQGQIEFVTFHQSYSYEEFVEGIKPDIDNESWNEPVEKLTYKGSNGIFKNISNRSIFNRLDIEQKQKDIILDFKNAKDIFIKKHNIGTILKTGVKGTEFRIDKYTPKSIRITPLNGKYTYSITFKYLEEAFNHKMISQNEISEINGVASGLSCYYYAIFQQLLQINQNKNKDFIRHNIDDIGEDEKLKLIKDYYAGKIALKNNDIDKQDKYILIIDEINRGNISKIFGELITLIEEDKRETLSVKLPYSHDTFTVPKNLYIIGTMNTSDRSIASIDIALRRRFKFIEMMPKSELVADFGCGFQAVFEKLNTKIKILLDRDHQIGHSYFISTKYTNADINNLKEIWFSKIIPLLNEYFYCDWDKLKLVIPGFIKVVDNIPEELKNDCEDSIYEFKTPDEVQDFVEALKQDKFGN